MLISAGLCINTSYLNDFLVQQYINNQKKGTLIFYDVFFSQYSHQHDLASAPAIFRVMFLKNKVVYFFIKNITLKMAGTLAKTCS